MTRMKWTTFILGVLVIILYIIVFHCLPAAPHTVSDDWKKLLAVPNGILSLSLLSDDAKSEDIQISHKKPKTVMRYVNTHDTIYAANINECETDLISFTFGDELECIESTLSNDYVEVLLENEVYIIERKHLSLDEPKPFKVLKDCGKFTLTAYAWTGNHCANGRYPRKQHTVAAHKKQFPLGTKLYIEGYGIFYVEDRGGFPMGVIDVYMEDHKTCVKFGKQKAHVYVLEWGDNRRWPAEKTKPVH